MKATNYSGQESIVDKSANWEAIVATDGVINVCNYSHENPSAHSVFIDMWDEKAVSCSCKDWEHRKPSGGCKHIKHVNANDALLMAAMSPQD